MPKGIFITILNILNIKENILGYWRNYMDTTSKVTGYLDGAIYTTNNIISLPFVKDEYYTDFVS